MSRWKVVAEPKGNNPGLVSRTAQRVGVGATPGPENIGGTIVYLVSDGGAKEEVSRVAFLRRAGVCRNPGTTYKQAFREEVARAQEIADSINALNNGDGVMA